MMNKSGNPLSAPPSLLLTTTNDIMNIGGPSLVPIVQPSASDTSTFVGQAPTLEVNSSTVNSPSSYFTNCDDILNSPGKDPMDSFGLQPDANAPPVPTYSTSEFCVGPSQMDPLNPPPLPSASEIPQSVPLGVPDNYSAMTPLHPASHGDPNISSSNNLWDDSLSIAPPLPNSTTHYGANANMANINTPYQPVHWHWFHKTFEKGGLRHSWKPFSVFDTSRLERAYMSGAYEEKIPTDGGRFDVSVAERQRYSVYWEEDPSEIRRCSWFYRLEGDAKFTPYEEWIALRLEGEYMRAVQTSAWHRRLEIPVDRSGRTEVFVFHNPSAMVHYRGAAQPHDEYGTTGFAVDQHARPCVVKRGVGSFDIELEEGEHQTVDHVIFVIHGIGEACDMMGHDLAVCVNKFRKKAHALVKSHFQPHSGRVEFLPVYWHGTLHGEATGLDKQMKKITLGSIPKLRDYTNGTLIDILFYTSPKYCQTIVDRVASEISRLRALFQSRNPKYMGSFSIAGHSLGSVIAFDILAHQDDNATTSTDVFADFSKETSSRSDTRSSPRPARTVTTVSQMLEQLQLPPPLMDIFETEQIDMESLALLTEADLKEIGVPLGPRKKILDYVKVWHTPAPATIEPPMDCLRASTRGSGPGDQEVVNYLVATTGMGQPMISFPELDLPYVTNFFALGSPIALFLTTRGLEQLGEDYRLPRCGGFFNIFHPFDPVAYRMETMVLPQLRLRPVLIPHHKGRKRMHLELKDSLSRMGADLKSRIVDSFWSTWRSLHQFASAHRKAPEGAVTEAPELDEEEVQQALALMEKESVGPMADMGSTSTEEEVAIGQLNFGRRIDFVLQESPLESFNDYIFALSSHACYWDSEDTALMILREVYTPLGVRCTFPSGAPAARSTPLPPPPPPPPVSLAPPLPPPIPNVVSPGQPGPPPGPPVPPVPTMPPGALAPPGPGQQGVFGCAPLLPRHGSLFRKGK